MSSSDPDLSLEQIRRLAELEIDRDGNVILGESELEEIAAYEKQLISERPARQKTKFHFEELIRRILKPEVVALGQDAAIDALLEVEHVALDDLGLEDTECLECLTNISHLYLQHNMLTSLSGLEFMTKLTVLVVNDNRITTLRPIAELPISHLDASNNLLQIVDIEADLPYETLKVLSLSGNPCAPDDADPEYSTAYLKELLQLCPRLELLDGDRITNDTRHSVGLPPRELDLLAAAVAANAAKSGTDQNSAMRTNFKEEDFLAESDDEEPQLVDDRIPEEENEEDEEELDLKVSETIEQKPETKTDKPKQKERQQHMEVEPGVASGIHRYTDSLLTRYQAKQAQKTHAVEEVLKEHDEQITKTDDEQFQTVKTAQQELRKDIHFAQEHHGRLAQMHLKQVFDSEDERLQKLRERLSHRSSRGAASQPSAAYQEAIAMLEKQKGNLDKYRNMSSSE